MILNNNSINFTGYFDSHLKKTLLTGDQNFDYNNKKINVNFDKFVIEIELDKENKFIAISIYYY